MAGLPYDSSHRNNTRAGQMVALASDLYVIATPGTTYIPAILVSIFHIAQACYVRAFF
jgi:hypothetical protein